jgi:hypothetical protein
MERETMLIFILLYLGAIGHVSQLDYTIGTPTSGTYVESCTATVFCNKGDTMCGGKSAYLKRLVKPDDVGVAHRTLPFGAKLTITNNRTTQSVDAWVIDRGPFGRLDADGVWYSGVSMYRKLRRASKTIPSTLASDGVDGWRGCIDLTPAVADAIGLNGKETVTFTVSKWPHVKDEEPNT